MSKIRYGQIGVGHAHASKISVYRNSPDYEVVGIVEPDEGLRRRAAEAEPYRDLPWMTQEQLLNLPDLHVVGVETRVEHLLDTAEACISAGKHIHLDKPAGASFPQFERIVREASARHLALQMGYMYRYSPAVLQMREWLQHGWLGEPFEIHTVMSKLVGAGERSELAKFSGGTMFELGCHLIDLVVGVLGAPDKVHAFPRHSAAAEDDLQDNMLAVLEYPRATATVRSSVNEVDGSGRRHFTLCGTAGTFHIQPLDSPAVRASLLAPHGKFKKGMNEIAYPKFHRYVADAADLAAVVRNEKAPTFSYDHDLAVQKTVLLASGMPVG